MSSGRRDSNAPRVRPIRPLWPARVISPLIGASRPITLDLPVDAGQHAVQEGLMSNRVDPDATLPQESLPSPPSAVEDDALPPCSGAIHTAQRHHHIKSTTANVPGGRDA